MSNGISDEAIAAYAADLIDLEGRINELQDDKKTTYASVRDAFGKRTADALKLAIKRYRMDADKREAADEVDAEADRFLSIIRSPRAPRATHAREIIEEIPDHDPETGEVNEGGKNVADRPVHVSEEPGRGWTSVNEPAEGSTHSATIPGSRDSRGFPHVSTPASFAPSPAGAEGEEDRQPIHAPRYEAAE